MTSKESWFHTDAPLGGTVDEIWQYLLDQGINPIIAHAASAIFASTRDLAYTLYRDKKLKSFSSSHDLAISLFEISMLGYYQMELYIKNSMKSPLPKWKNRRLIEELWIAAARIFVNDEGLENLYKIILARRGDLVSAFFRNYDYLDDTPFNDRILADLHFKALELVMRLELSVGEDVPEFSYAERDVSLSDQVDMVLSDNNDQAQYMCSFIRLWFWKELAQACEKEARIIESTLAKLHERGQI